jgi:uncharacterized protein
MKLIRTFFVGLVFALLFVFAQGVFAYQSPGKPTGLVNDFAGVLSSDQKSQLESKLESFRNQTSNEIAIVTIPTLGDTPIEDYANQLFREWGIGSKENNNGILILAAINDHQLRIEVGYGLEGAVPDLLTKQIQEQEIIPSFKNGNYAEGLNKGVDALMQASQGEYTGNNQDSVPQISTGMIIFILIFVFQFLVAILAPSKSWWFGGVLGGVAGGIIGYIGGALLFGIIGAVAGIGIGLLLDYFVSKNYKGGGRGGGPWFFGGFGGGGSGGGFGGFGGGSSGGGGSSSSW